MVDISIVNGDYFMVYKPTYNWGAPLELQSTKVLTQRYFATATILHKCWDCPGPMFLGVQSVQSQHWMLIQLAVHPKDPVIFCLDHPAGKMGFVHPFKNCLVETGTMDFFLTFQYFPSYWEYHDSK